MTGSIRSSRAVDVHARREVGEVALVTPCAQVGALVVTELDLTRVDQPKLCAMPKADEGSIDRRPRLDTGDRPGETWREDGAYLRLANSPGDTRANRRYGGAPEGYQEDREDTEEAMAHTPQSIPAASASDLRGGVDLDRRHRLIISLVVGACLGFTYLP